MNNSFNGFPIDGTAGTLVKYDMFAQHMTSAMRNAANVNTGNAAMTAFIFMILSLPLIVLCSLLLFFSMMFKKLHYQLRKKEIEREKENLRLEFIRRDEELKQTIENKKRLEAEKLDDMLSGLEGDEN